MRLGNVLTNRQGKENAELRKLLDELEYSNQEATVGKQIYEAAYNQVKVEADEAMDEQEERFREDMVHNRENNLRPGTRDRIGRQG
jgi:hypothetical protein